MNAQFIGKIQDWENEATTYEFILDGQQFEITERSFPTPMKVTSRGEPVSDDQEAIVLSSCIVTDEMRAE